MKKNEIDIHAVVNITPEELSKYPALERALNGEVCVEYEPEAKSWLCKVTYNDWVKIREFIYIKSTSSNGSAPFCYKFGEMNGGTCYAFSFNKP